MAVTRATDDEALQGVAEMFLRWHPVPRVEISPDFQIYCGDGVADGNGWAVGAGLRMRLSL